MAKKVRKIDESSDFHKLRFTKAEAWDALKHVFGMSAKQNDATAQGKAHLFTYDDIPAPGNGEIDPETDYVSIKRIPKPKMQWWKKALILFAVVFSFLLSQILGYANFASVELTYEDLGKVDVLNTAIEKYAYLGSGDVLHDWVAEAGLEDAPEGTFALKIFLGLAAQTTLRIYNVTETVKIKKSLKQHIDDLLLSYTDREAYDAQQEQEEIDSLRQIPDAPVVAIAPFAVANQGYLKTVHIGPSVQYIGLWAFSNCANLENIFVDPANPYFCDVDGVVYSKDMTELVCFPMGKRLETYVVPDTVKVIKKGAFYHFINNEESNTLRRIELPNGLETIEDTAFFGNKYLEEIVIPDTVTYIGIDAFSKCWGTTPYLFIPKNVSFVGDYAFFDCLNLDLICFEADEKDALYIDDKHSLQPKPGKILIGEFWKPKIDPAMFKTNYPAVIFGKSREEFEKIAEEAAEKLKEHEDGKLKKEDYNAWLSAQ